MVGEVSDIIQVDESLTATMCLAALSACCAKKGLVNLGSHKEPVNLYLIAVLDSGERKSPTVARMMEPIHQFEKRLRTEAKRLLSENKSKEKVRDARFKKLHLQHAKENDPEKITLIENELRQLELEGNSDSVSTLPRLTVDDITQESLGEVLAANNERIAIISAEGGIFSIIMGVYKSGEVSIDLFLKSHNLEPYSSDRIGRGNVTLSAPAVTIGLAVQSQILNDLGQNKQLRGRGLLARFLYAVPQPRAGFRPYQDRSLSPDLERAYVQSLTNLLELPEEQKEFTLSPEAKQLWVEFYSDTERLLRSGEDLDDLKDWGSKLPGEVARIAGLLLMAEHGHNVVEISEEKVAAACAIGSFFAEHALAAFGIMHQNPALEAAVKIVDHIKAKELPVFTKRDLQMQINRFRKERIEPGLELLVDHGYIVGETPEPTTGRGRPRGIQYRVNPKVFGSQEN